MSNKIKIVFVLSLLTLGSCQSVTSSIPLDFSSESVPASNNDSTGLNDQKVALFSNNSQVALVNSNDNYEVFFKNHYKDFNEVPAEDGLITFELDNYFSNYTFKAYYCINTPHFYNVSVHNKTTIDNSNGKILVSSSFQDVLTCRRRTMFLYSFSNEKETLYLPVYWGSSFVNNNAINDLIIPQANIKSISIERKDAARPVDGEFVAPTTTITKEDEDTLKEYCAIFNDYELLDASENRMTTPGYSTYTIQIENTSNEIIDFLFYDGFLSYKGNSYVLENRNVIINFLSSFFKTNNTNN